MSVETFLAEYERVTIPLVPDEPEVNSRLCPRHCGGDVELDLYPKTDNGGDPYLYLSTCDFDTDIY
jgi:hypothetical protein